MNGDHDCEEAIFEQALNRPSASEREACLREACGADEAMRQRLLGLLQAHERAGGFLENGHTQQAELASAVKAAADAEDLAGATFVPLTEKSGDRIGHYKLLERIGEGGFGVVWMAEQEEPVRRRVALKIIKLGMDTREVVARFEAERQALALMDHAHIARVLDGGATATGRPYFVMELVQGIPITTYCDANRLPPRARLELVVTVCQAVQHAHQKGVIHRDLKPSNILVTVADGRPVPKVIDFGVAKAIEGRLTAKTVATLSHQLIGTPCYMSPEQAGRGGLDVDTRSDIYSLGVLLYELLTGRTPFGSKELLEAGVDEMRRIIREKNPPRPSTRLTALVAADVRRLTSTARSREPTSEIDRDSLRRRLQEKKDFLRLIRGDLDWIVMRCLEKDRARRYATANGLAADLQRHLNHEPIVARPPSRLYRFRKMVRRNLVAFTLVNTLAAAISIGLGVSLWSLGREREAHRQVHEAEQKLTVGLRNAYLAQARANRFSGQPGRRFDSLEALRLAAANQPGLDLRNEAIACLALPDVRVAREWRLPFETSLKAFDPKLRAYACADRNGTITLHRVDDPREILRLPSPGARTWLPEFSPDGRFLAVEYFTRPRTVRVWSLESGRAVLQVPSGRRFAFRPDSQEIAISTETNSVVIHSLPSGQGLKSIPEPGRPHLRYSPDGQRLAAGSDARSDVRVYDLASLKLRQTLAIPRRVFALAWHPDGHQLAAAGDDNHIHLFEVATGKSLAKLHGHQSAAVRLAYNHAGNLLASSGWDGDLCLWDPERGAFVLKFPNAHIYQFSRDDRFLGIDQGESNLKLLEVADGRECRLLQMRTEAGQSAWAVSFHPGGRVLASAKRDGVSLWDALTGKSIASLEISNTPAALFHPPTGDLLTTSQHGLERRPVLFEQTPEGQRMRLSSPRQLVQSSLKRATISQDGTLLVATHTDDGADLFELAGTDQPRCIRLRHPGTEFVAISPDGQWVATGTWHDTGVRVWEGRTGKPVVELPLAAVINGVVPASVTFSPDGQWLVTGTGKEYAFWTVGTWERHHTIPQAEGNRPPGTIAFSRDPRWAVLSHGRRSLRLIESPSGEHLATLEAPEPHNVWAMTLSPDGRFVAAATDGHLIQLWDLARLRQQLAALNLDWESPPSPPVETTVSVLPLRVEVQ